MTMESRNVSSGTMASLSIGLLILRGGTWASTEPWLLCSLKDCLLKVGDFYVAVVWHMTVFSSLVVLEPRNIASSQVFLSLVRDKIVQLCFFPSHTPLTVTIFQGPV